jgi:hypothetical protein
LKRKKKIIWTQVLVAVRTAQFNIILSETIGRYREDES